MQDNRNWFTWNIHTYIEKEKERDRNKDRGRERDTDRDIDNSQVDSVSLFIKLFLLDFENIM